MDQKWIYGSNMDENMDKKDKISQLMEIFIFRAIIFDYQSKANNKTLLIKWQIAR